MQVINSNNRLSFIDTTKFFTISQRFLEDGELKVQTLDHGFAWLDT